MFLNKLARGNLVILKLKQAPLKPFDLEVLYYFYPDISRQK